MRELEKAGNHRHAVTQRNVAGDGTLGQPVQKQNYNRNHEKVLAHEKL